VLQICEDIVLWMTRHNRILHRKKPKRKEQEIERDCLGYSSGKVQPMHAAPLSI
jgi:hypothetical protein